MMDITLAIDVSYCQVKMSGHTTDTAKSPGLGANAAVFHTPIYSSEPSWTSWSIALVVNF